MVFSITDSDGGAFLNEMAESMRDQDNRITAHPMYVVEELCDKRWLIVTVFFTDSGAKNWIKENEHNGTYRIYVASGYNNPEWKAVRRLLIGDGRDD